MLTNRIYTHTVEIHTLTHTHAWGIFFLAAGCNEEVAVRMVSLELELGIVLFVYPRVCLCAYVCVLLSYTVNNRIAILDRG